MRRRKIKGALEVYKSYDQYALTTDHLAVDDLQNSELYEFLKHEPCALEIGSGRGGFLVEMAKRNAGCHFLGIEMKEELLMKAVHKAQEAHIQNGKFLLADVTQIEAQLSRFVFDTLYLNFSDPWPKDRHAKRRLTHPNFLKLYARLLKDQGRLIIKTDNHPLYGYTLESLLQSGYDILETTEDLRALNDVDNVPTEYEQRFVERGQCIYRIIAKPPAQL